MNGFRLSFAGREVVATPAGALFVKDEQTLVVADLHLEKGSALARSGRFLPPYDSQETLARLACEIAACDPGTVICLGDSFHDERGAARLGAEARATLAQLMAGRGWIWVAGNHDRGLARTVGGEVAGQVVLGSLVLRHQARVSALVVEQAEEVSGHFHPKASVKLGGRRISGRCFVTDGRRLILPAFGAYTGGLNVLDPAISCLLSRDFSVLLVARNRIHRFPRAALSAAV